jgi:hypothetical protein
VAAGRVSYKLEIDLDRKLSGEGEEDRKCAEAFSWRSNEANVLHDGSCSNVGALSDICLVHGLEDVSESQAA